MVPDRIRQRYLRDPLPVRLGGLAADLARIATCAVEPRDRAALMSLLEESKWFAEWAAPDAPIEIQEVLAALQIEVACWQRRWMKGNPKPSMSARAQEWADQFLALAGLT